MGFFDYDSSRSESSSECESAWYYAVAVGREPGIYTDHEEAMDHVFGFSGFRMKKFRTSNEARDYISEFEDYFSSSSEESQEETWYYAVAVGRSTGIYTDWQDAVAQVNRFSGFKMKKFSDYGEAEEYLAKNEIYDSSEQDSEMENLDDALQHTRGYSFAKFKKFSLFKKAEWFLSDHDLEIDDGHEFEDGSMVWFAYDANGGSGNFSDPKHPDTLVAFCDGSALRNGQRDCDAAYACIFPHNRDWDAVKTVRGPWATNNRAEYLAALAAMRRANRQDPCRDQVLYIYTDSIVLINSMTNWIHKWRSNGWQTVNGTEVKNRDILQHLLAAQGDRRVLWCHVRAHTGIQDWESYWNDVADGEAREAAQNCSYQT